MIIDGTFNNEKFIKFLQALIQEAGKKIFLIVDNLRVHHSKQVKAWLAELTDQIETFYLPGHRLEHLRKSLILSSQPDPVLALFNPLHHWADLCPWMSFA